MKLFVQETRSSLIKNSLFADNDVGLTIQWLPLSGKIVHKANMSVANNCGNMYGHAKTTCRPTFV